MHRLRCAYNARAVCLRNCLMTKTDAEYGKVAVCEVDEIQTNSRFIRRARSWRKNNCVWPEGKRLGSRQFIVSAHNNFRTKLPQIVEEVVGETVIVIDQKKQKRTCNPRYSAQINHATSRAIRPIYDGGAVPWKSPVAAQSEDFQETPGEHSRLRHARREATLVWRG